MCVKGPSDGFVKPWARNGSLFKRFNIRMTFVCETRLIVSYALNFLYVVGGKQREVDGPLAMHLVIY